MNRCKIILTSLALMCAGGVLLSAQGGYGVSGTVQDNLGPVIGATVVEQGTNNGTTTDTDGGYSLTVTSPDSPVVFSCRGYDTYGFFEKIGGIAKNHPNEKDFKKAREFIKNNLR